MNKINKPNKIVNIESIKDKNDNIKIINTEGYFESRFNLTEEDLYDGKKIERFVKKVEKNIRSSDEYSTYLGVLKNEKGLNRCAFLSNISGDDAEIEFHHYPFTLYEIVFISLIKLLSEGKKVNSFYLTRYVLDLHAKNLIGLVPLCVLVHQLYHSGAIFINMNKVFGKVEEFKNIFEPYINDNLIEKYNKIIEKSEQNISYSDSDILALADKYLKKKEIKNETTE